MRYIILIMDLAFQLPWSSGYPINGLEKMLQGNTMSPKPTPITVLLVDDEALVRKNASTILKAEGFEVIEAVDGLDALYKYQISHDEISVIIMDIHMPKLNGISAARRIRELDFSSRIIFISGSTFQAPSEDLADAFLTKPLRGRDLVNAVRRVLRQKKVQGPAATEG